MVKTGSGVCLDGRFVNGGSSMVLMVRVDVGIELGVGSEVVNAEEAMDVTLQLNEYRIWKSRLASDFWEEAMLILSIIEATLCPCEEVTDCVSTLDTKPFVTSGISEFD
jgi:hypothetical protein